MAGKERVFPVQRNRTDGPLNGIVVELDAAISQEQLKPSPVFGDVAECFPKGRFRGDAGAMKVAPCLYPRDSWSGSFLASSKTLFRAEASDISFDGLELADESHTLFRNRGGAGARDIDQLATGMCPAIGELYIRADAAGKAEVTFWDDFGTKQRTKRDKIVFRYIITSVIFHDVRKHNQVVK